jgi:hypothetical protein
MLDDKHDKRRMKLKEWRQQKFVSSERSQNTDHKRNEDIREWGKTDINTIMKRYKK